MARGRPTGRPQAWKLFDYLTSPASFNVLYAPRPAPDFGLVEGGFFGVSFSRRTAFPTIITLARLNKKSQSCCTGSFAMTLRLQIGALLHKTCGLQCLIGSAPSSNLWFGRRIGCHVPTFSNGMVLCEQITLARLANRKLKLLHGLRFRTL